MVTARGDPARRARAAARRSRPRSTRWRCSSAAPIRRELAEAARIGEDFGYDEINLNVGCPSDRVQDGPLRRLPDGGAGAGRATASPRCGRRCACRSPSSAASASTTRTARPTSSASSIPSPAPAADTFIVHARKAWLKGLSPKENREVPPLDYERVRAAEGRAARADDRPQRRHRHARRGRARISNTSTA